MYRAQSFFLSITYFNIVLKEGFLRPVSFSFSASYNEACFSPCFKEVEQNTTPDGWGGLATDEMSRGSHFAEACSNFYLQCNCTLVFNFRKKKRLHLPQTSLPPDKAVLPRDNAKWHNHIKFDSLPTLHPQIRQRSILTVMRVHVAVSGVHGKERPAVRYGRFGKVRYRSMDLLLD